MRIKTSELTGVALDWAVAKCEGMDNLRKNPHKFDDAEQAIQEDPLSVEVRTDWFDPGEESPSASEFCILLCTGGPAVRIRGDLDEDGVPNRAYMEYQDWGTPWTSYYEDGVGNACLEYAQNFYFGG